ncbi:MAG TPA: hypothetical protein VJ999_01920 [Candidatus Sulfotelmatobacter sp.]|nr:hypothetical protein [Candidatus Sulfotelmatobacter sp.]
MPAEPIAPSLPSGPEIELTAITEQELLKPGAIKLLCKRNSELESDNRTLRAQLEAEAGLSGGHLDRAHGAEMRCSILTERIGALGYRNAVCQTIWGAVAIVTGLAIDFAKSREWSHFGFSVAVIILLVIAVYLASKEGKPPADQPREAGGDSDHGRNYLRRDHSNS